MIKKKVHIAIVSKADDTSDMNAIKAGLTKLGADGLYIIYPRQKGIQESIEESFKDFPIKPSFDIPHEEGNKKLDFDISNENQFEKIVCLIIEIVQHYGEDDIEGIWINFSKGTNFMCAASILASRITRSYSYYVFNNEIVEIPPQSDDTDLENLDFIILNYLNTKHFSNDTDIIESLIKDYTPRKIRYSLNKLRKKQYIQSEKEGRENINSLEMAGRIAIKARGIYHPGGIYEKK